jgi:hypothetical protein
METGVWQQSKNPVLGFHGWDETAPQGLVYRGEGGGGATNDCLKRKSFFLKPKTSTKHC